MTIKQKGIKQDNSKKLEIPIPSFSVKEGITIWYQKIKNFISKFWTFAISKPNAKENVFQYMFRQLILTDSAGNPSWTVTVLFFVMIINAVVLYAEYQLALSPVMTYTPEGKIATWQLKGFSTEFYYLILSLSVVITGLFRARQKDQSSTDTESAGIIDTAVDTFTAVKDKVNKLKSKI